MFEQLIKIISTSDVTVVSSEIGTGKTTLATKIEKSVIIDKSIDVIHGKRNISITQDELDLIKSNDTEFLIVDEIQCFFLDQKELVKTIDVAFNSGKKIVLLSQDLQMIDNIKLNAFCRNHSLSYIHVNLQGIDRESGNLTGFSISDPNFREASK